MLGIDSILIILVCLVLSLVIVLYIALVLKFVLRKAQKKSVPGPDDPQTSFIERMSGWHPFRVANTKCVPIQPRTYDELKTV